MLEDQKGFSRCYCIIDVVIDEMEDMKEELEVIRQRTHAMMTK